MQAMKLDAAPKTPGAWWGQPHRKTGAGPAADRPGGGDAVNVQPTLKGRIP